MARRTRRKQTMKKLLLFLGLLIPTISIAQNYSIDWYEIAGGGGTSTGATYQVTGTIGQPDASGAMTGGSYSLTGGFWSLISVVQTAGAPTSTITHSGNTVKVSWPYPSTALARAEALTPKRRKEIARKAAAARWGKKKEKEKKQQ